MDHYLIVSEGGREYVLRKGSRAELEKLARKLRAAKLFPYVRVDTHAPPEGLKGPLRSPPADTVPGNGGGETTV